MVISATFAETIIRERARLLGRVCNCTSDNNFMRKSDLLLTEIVVDVDIGYFERNNYWRAYSLGQEEICDCPLLCFSIGVLAGLLLCFELRVTKMRVPSRRECGPPTRCFHTLRYASTGLQLHLGTQLHRKIYFLLTEIHVDGDIGRFRRNDH